METGGFFEGGEGAVGQEPSPKPRLLGEVGEKKKSAMRERTLSKGLEEEKREKKSAKEEEEENVPGRGGGGEALRQMPLRLFRHSNGTRRRVRSLNSETKERKKKSLFHSQSFHAEAGRRGEESEDEEASLPTSSSLSSPSSSRDRLLQTLGSPGRGLGRVSQREGETAGKPGASSSSPRKKKDVSVPSSSSSPPLPSSSSFVFWRRREGEEEKESRRRKEGEGDDRAENGNARESRKEEISTAGEPPKQSRRFSFLFAHRFSWGGGEGGGREEEEKRQSSKGSSRRASVSSSSSSSPSQSSSCSTNHTSRPREEEERKDLRGTSSALLSSSSPSLARYPSTSSSSFSHATRDNGGPVPSSPSLPPVRRTSVSSSSSSPSLSSSSASSASPCPSRDDCTLVKGSEEEEEEKKKKKERKKEEEEEKVTTEVGLADLREACQVIHMQAQEKKRKEEKEEEEAEKSPSKPTTLSSSSSSCCSLPFPTRADFSQGSLLLQAMTSPYISFPLSSSSSPPYFSPSSFASLSRSSSPLLSTSQTQTATRPSSSSSATSSPQPQPSLPLLPPSSSSSTLLGRASLSPASASSPRVSSATSFFSSKKSTARIAKGEGGPESLKDVGEEVSSSFASCSPPPALHRSGGGSRVDGKEGGLFSSLAEGEEEEGGERRVRNAPVADEKAEEEEEGTDEKESRQEDGSAGAGEDGREEGQGKTRPGRGEYRADIRSGGGSGGDVSGWKEEEEKKNLSTSSASRSFLSTVEKHRAGEGEQGGGGGQGEGGEGKGMGNEKKGGKGGGVLSSSPSSSSSGSSLPRGHLAHQNRRVIRRLCQTSPSLPRPESRWISLKIGGAPPSPRCYGCGGSWRDSFFLFGGLDADGICSATVYKFTFLSNRAQRYVWLLCCGVGDVLDILDEGFKSLEEASDSLLAPLLGSPEKPNENHDDTLQKDGDSKSRSEDEEEEEEPREEGVEGKKSEKREEEEEEQADRRGGLVFDEIQKEAKRLRQTWVHSQCYKEMTAFRESLFNPWLYPSYLSPSSLAPSSASSPFSSSSSSSSSLPPTIASDTDFVSASIRRHDELLSSPDLLGALKKLEDLQRAFLSEAGGLTPTDIVQARQKGKIDETFLKRLREPPQEEENEGAREEEKKKKKEDGERRGDVIEGRRVGNREKSAGKESPGGSKKKNRKSPAGEGGSGEEAARTSAESGREQGSSSTFSSSSSSSALVARVSCEIEKDSEEGQRCPERLEGGGKESIGPTISTPRLTSPAAGREGIPKKRSSGGPKEEASASSSFPSPKTKPRHEERRKAPHDEWVRINDEEVQVEQEEEKSGESHREKDRNISSFSSLKAIRFGEHVRVRTFDKEASSSSFSPRRVVSRCISSPPAAPLSPSAPLPSSSSSTSSLLPSSSSSPSSVSPAAASFPTPARRVGYWRASSTSASATCSADGGRGEEREKRIPPQSDAFPLPRFGGASCSLSSSLFIFGGCSATSRAKSPSTPTSTSQTSQASSSSLPTNRLRRKTSESSLSSSSGPPSRLLTRKRADGEGPEEEQRKDKREKENGGGGSEATRRSSRSASFSLPHLSSYRIERKTPLVAERKSDDFSLSSSPSAFLSRAGCGEETGHEKAKESSEGERKKKKKEKADALVLHMDISSSSAFSTRLVERGDVDEVEAKEEDLVKTEGELEEIDAQQHLDAPQSPCPTSPRLSGLSSSSAGLKNQVDENGRRKGEEGRRHSAVTTLVVDVDSEVDTVAGELSRQASARSEDLERDAGKASEVRLVNLNDLWVLDMKKQVWRFLHPGSKDASSSSSALPLSRDVPSTSSSADRRSSTKYAADCPTSPPLFSSSSSSFSFASSDPPPCLFSSSSSSSFSTLSASGGPYKREEEEDRDASALRPTLSLPHSFSVQNSAKRIASSFSSGDGDRKKKTDNEEEGDEAEVLGRGVFQKEEKEEDEEKKEKRVKARAVRGSREEERERAGEEPRPHGHSEQEEKMEEEEEEAKEPAMSREDEKSVLRVQEFSSANKPQTPPSRAKGKIHPSPSLGNTKEKSSSSSSSSSLPRSRPVPCRRRDATLSPVRLSASNRLPPSTCLLLYGGIDDESERVLDDVWLFDLKTLQWEGPLAAGWFLPVQFWLTSSASLKPPGHAYHTACTLHPSGGGERSSTRASQDTRNKGEGERGREGRGRRRTPLSRGEKMPIFSNPPPPPPSLLGHEEKSCSRSSSSSFSSAYSFPSPASASSSGSGASLTFSRDRTKSASYSASTILETRRFSSSSSSSLASSGDASETKKKKKKLEDEEEPHDHGEDLRACQSGVWIRHEEEKRERKESEIDKKKWREPNGVGSEKEDLLVSEAKASGGEESLSDPRRVEAQEREGRKTKTRAEEEEENEDDDVFFSSCGSSETLQAAQYAQRAGVFTALSVNPEIDLSSLQERPEVLGGRSREGESGSSFFSSGSFSSFCTSPRGTMWGSRRREPQVRAPISSSPSFEGYEETRETTNSRAEEDKEEASEKGEKDKKEEGDGVGAGEGRRGSERATGEEEEEEKRGRRRRGNERDDETREEETEGEESDCVEEAESWLGSTVLIFGGLICKEGSGRGTESRGAGKKSLTAKKKKRRGGILKEEKTAGRDTKRANARERGERGQEEGLFLSPTNIQIGHTRGGTKDPREPTTSLSEVALPRPSFSFPENRASCMPSISEEDEGEKSPMITQREEEGEKEEEEGEEQKKSREALNGPRSSEGRRGEEGRGKREGEVPGGVDGEVVGEKTPSAAAEGGRQIRRKKTEKVRGEDVVHEEEEEAEKTKRKKTFWERLQLLHSDSLNHCPQTLHDGSLLGNKAGGEEQEEEEEEEEEQDSAGCLYADQVEVTNALYEYYPDSRVWIQWETKGTPPCPRFRHSAVICGMDLYVLGGCDEAGELCPLRVLHQLHVPTKTWRSISLGGVNIRPADLLTTLASDGCLHVFGGRDSVGELTNVLYSVTISASGGSSSSSLPGKKGGENNKRKAYQRHPRRSSSASPSSSSPLAGGVFSSFFSSSSS